ncbi:MAG TPA: phosphopantetheine-binding protein [Pilimelia sp.]|nr:phosphopantetheine-binding protein [Pilimelia sp.]
MGRTETEHVIASVWCEVLGISRVGTSANFFDIGGTSKAAVVVRERLGHRLGRALSEVELFQYPTIGALAAYLDGNAGGIQRAARRDVRHLSGRRIAGRHGLRPGRGAPPVRHGEE